jgi:hypothetical protein
MDIIAMNNNAVNLMLSDVSEKHPCVFLSALRESHALAAESA